MHVFWCVYRFSFCVAGTIDGVNLTDFLVFVSGAETIPLLGLAKPIKLFFLHTDDTLPTASTCSIHLHLPVVHTEYNKFKDIMIVALKGHGGFGLV